jgi:hypothetical protein
LIRIAQASRIIARFFTQKAMKGGGKKSGPSGPDESSGEIQKDGIWG